MTDRTRPAAADPTPSTDTSDDRTRPDDRTPSEGGPRGGRPEGERDALEQVADRTSERIQPEDPYTEPPNSTVDDWFGQRVEHDAELLDETSSTDAPGALASDPAPDDDER